MTPVGRAGGPEVTTLCAVKSPWITMRSAAAYKIGEGELQPDERGELCCVVSGHGEGTPRLIGVSRYGSRGVVPGRCLARDAVAGYRFFQQDGGWVRASAGIHRRSSWSMGEKTRQPMWSSRRRSQLEVARTSHPA